MTVFEQLSYDQQVQWWTGIAEDALEAYALHDARLELLTYSNNAVFSVRARDARFVLRLHRPELARERWIRSELLWLRAICDNSDLVVPYPVETRAGDLVASVRVERLSAPVHAVLFRHIEGESRQPADISADEVGQVGVFLAKLHSIPYTPPDDFQRPRLDWEGLFGEESLYDPGEGARLFSAEQREVFAAVAKRVREVMAALGQGADHFGLIHADLLCKNVLFHQGAARALDFEYCGRGYYLYDLTPILWQLRDNGRYPELLQAMWQGYTSIRPLSENQRELLEVFIAGRHLASCRWIAGNLGNASIREKAPQILAERTGEMRRFLETGRLERRSEIL